MQLRHRHGARACRVGHDGGDGVGQGLHLGHGVHVGADFAADHIAQEGFFDAGGDTGHADGGVLRCRGVCTRVWGGPVGFGQNSVVGIDDGLHFNAGIGEFTIDGGAGQRVLNGGEVVGIDAGDGGGREMVECRAGARGGDQTRGVGFGKGADHIQRVAGRIGCCGDDGLHFGQAVGIAAAVGFGGDGGQHGRQVVGRDAAQACLRKVRCIERRRAGACSGHALDGVGNGGQLVELGNGVHLSGLQAAHDVVEQGQVVGVGGRVADARADEGVLRCGRIDRGRCVSGGVARGVGGVVGFAQDGVVSVDDGLHFGRGVGAVFVVGVAQRGVGACLVVDGVVDGAQVGRSTTRHTSHTGVGVVLRGGRGVVHTVFGISRDLVDRCSLRSRCSGDDGLHLAQAVGVCAAVGFGGDGGQHGRQVVGRDARQTHFGEVGFGQCRRRCATGSQSLDGVGDAGEFVDLGHGVHIGSLLARDDVAEQAEVFSVVRGGTDVCTHGGVLRCGGVGRGGRGVVAHTVGGVIGLGEDDLVGVDDGLHFGRGVSAVFVVGVAQDGIAALLAVDGVVDGIQIARSPTRHTGHTSVGIVLCGRRGIVHAIFGIGRDLVDRRCLRGGGGGDEGLQFTQRIGFAAVRVFASDGSEHGGQVVHGHAAQTGLDEVGFDERRRRCATRSHGLDGVGDAGEFVDLGHGVDVGSLQATHDVVEQGQVFNIAGRSANVSTDQRVLLVAGVKRGGGRVVAGAAIDIVGFSQDDFVGIDDGLHLGRSGGCSTVDGGTGQGVVDGVDVVGIDAHHTGGHVSAERRHGARSGNQTACVGVGKGAQVAQGHHGGGGGGGDDDLQLAQAVGLRAVVGFGSDGGQHGRQVVGAHARQPHRGEVGRGQCRVGRATRGDQFDGVGNAGQVVDLGDGVDTAALLAADDVAQQVEVFTVSSGSANVGTDGRVLRSGSVGRSSRRVVACSGVRIVGLGQDGVVGIDDGLHFGSGVRTVFVVAVAQDEVAALLAVDGVVDGAEVGGAHALHTCSGVVGIGRCGVSHTVFGVGSDLIDRRALRSGCGDDDRLQLTQRVGLRAVVSFGCDGREHGGKVVGGHTGQAQRDEVGHAQCGRGCAVGRRQLDGVGDAGQGVDLGDGVHVSGLLACDGIVQEAEVFNVVGGGANIGTDECVLIGGGFVCGVGGGVACAVGHVVGLRQDGVVGVDDGLHLRAGVGGLAVDAGTGQGVFDGVEVGRIDAGHASGGEVSQHRRGACGAGQTGGVGFGVSAEGGQCAGGGLGGAAQNGLQLAQRIGGAAVVVLRGDGGQHSRQVVGGHAGQASFGKVCCGQRRRGCAVGGSQLDGVGDARQVVDGRDGVDVGGLQAADDVVQEVEVFCIGGSAADVGADQGVLIGRGVGARCGVGRGVACGVGGVVGLAKNSVVGVDDGLHFGGGVRLRKTHRQTGQRVVDRAQVVVVHTGHTGVDVSAQHRRCARAGVDQARGVGLCKSAE